MNKNPTILQSSVAVIAVVLGSKVLGFLRQVVIAMVYGSNSITDIYFVSSDFMISISSAFIASLTTAMVAVYIDIAMKKSRKEANDLSSKMLTIFLMAGVVFILIMNLFAHPIAKILAPGYTPDQTAMLIKYLRMFSIVFIFTAFQSLYSSVLNANKSFAPGKLYGMVYNPIAIVLMILLSDRIGINALVLAYILGNIGQTILLGWWCKDIYRFRPNLHLKDENVKNLILLSLPLLLSNLFLQLNRIVDKMICSLLGEGIASSYTYAYTLEQFVTATLTATASLVLLSHFAIYVSEGDTPMVIKTFKNAISTLLLLLCPIAVVTIVCSMDIVSVVYLRGNFDHNAAISTASALIGFGVGFPLVAVREMYIRLHFSYQDTKRPMVANVATVCLNMVMSITLSRFIGVLGITLATSLSILLTIFMLSRSLKEYLPQFQLGQIKGLFIKIILACLCSVAVILPMDLLSFPHALLALIVKAALGLTVYAVVLLLLRCQEFYGAIDTVKDIVEKRVFRKPSK